MFDTILIANRGEIACRIISTCRKMGVRAIAVYSDADARARHVRMADEAFHIGPSPALESYLRIDRILDAVKRSGAQAIHPGYGFLSENAEFAEACAQQGVVFIGPPPAAIRAMGSKAAAKVLMREAGVPLTPGYDGPNQTAEFLAEQAATIGYPVMIKANAGGGGKGMRRVDSPDQFQASLASCKREAASSFGDDSVLIEKYLVEPRHVEVQVFGDTHGNVISLFERDCSVQRRHQKVIEEAPAPLLSEGQRSGLSAAACSAARAVGYVGAGTVEFLLDREGRFYFMEMNTRLQVEHPVTEMITGLDLVEWQLRIAAGEALPLRQEEVTMYGHAIEARIYAEDPSHDFAPSIGKLVHLRMPSAKLHVRVDTGVEQGDTITAHYDPMIAKLIVWGETRESAVLRVNQALSELEVVGVANNVDFLRGIATSGSFTETRLDTNLIGREHSWIERRDEENLHSGLLIAALAVAARERASASGSSPWTVRDGWRMNSRLVRQLRFVHGKQAHSVELEYRATDYGITVDGSEHDVSELRVDEKDLNAMIDGAVLEGTVVEHHGRVHVFVEGQHSVLQYDDPLAGHGAAAQDEGNLLAPMPGRVISLSVEPGARVEKGEPLMLLEAMKMECTVYAPAAGRVTAFNFGAGDQVTEGAQLLHFEAEEGEE